METIVILLKNKKAKKLLDDLAGLDLIELKKDNTIVKENRNTNKLSDLKNRITHQMTENEIDHQIEALRKEWQRDT